MRAWRCGGEGRWAEGWGRAGRQPCVVGRAGAGFEVRHGKGEEQEREQKWNMIKHQGGGGKPRDRSAEALPP